MALIGKKLSLTAAALAATSMVATPGMAAELPQIANNNPQNVSTYDGSADEANGWRRRRHRNRVDAGDVIAGVLVLGTIAAIASSASNSRDRRNERRREDVRYREPSRSRQTSWGSGGIDSAVDMCVDQVERGQTRVDSVDNASRDGSGWAVSGSLDNGEYFNCRIDNEGRIRSIDLGDNLSAYDVPAGSSTAAQLQAGSTQWSDADYARARSAAQAQGRESVSSYRVSDGAGYVSAEPRTATRGIDGDLSPDQIPAYPGGPLPGEEGYEEAMGG